MGRTSYYNLCLTLLSLLIVFMITSFALISMLDFGEIEQIFEAEISDQIHMDVAASSKDLFSFRLNAFSAEQSCSTYDALAED